MTETKSARANVELRGIIRYPRNALGAEHIMDE